MLLVIFIFKIYTYIHVHMPPYTGNNGTYLAMIHAGSFVHPSCCTKFSLMMIKKGRNVYEEIICNCSIIKCTASVFFACVINCSIQFFRKLDGGHGLD